MGICLLVREKIVFASYIVERKGYIENAFKYEGRENDAEKLEIDFQKPVRSFQASIFRRI